MISTTFPIFILAATLAGAYELAWFYGIAIIAVGMLSNTGIQFDIDAYGPVSDNAGGNAKMAEHPREVCQKADKIDFCCSSNFSSLFIDQAFSANGLFNLIRLL